MKKITIAVFAFLILVLGVGGGWSQTAKKHFGRSCIDGSCAAGYDLDDVTDMSDGDTALVPADPTYGGPLVYIYNESSTATEHLPDVVDPNQAGNGRWILQNPPPAPIEPSIDGTYYGSTQISNGGYTTIPQWQPVVIDPADNNEWKMADADSSVPSGSINSTAEGITVTSCTNGNPCRVLVRGSFKNNSFTGVWSDGELLFLSDDPADTDCATDEGGGKKECYGWTNTPPSTQYDIVQPIGRVRDDGSNCIIRVDINGISDWATVP